MARTAPFHKGNRVKSVAFLIHCPGCKGGGELRLGRTEINCPNCNGYGYYIQQASNKEMLKYLEENAKT